MIIKAVKNDEQEVTMLVFYAQTKNDISCLSEILPASIGIVKEHLNKEDSDAGTSNQNPTA